MRVVVLNINMSKLKLNLTAGQIAWTMWRPLGGRPAEPPAKFLARLRYLKKEGVPFSEAELAKGSGYNQIYGFDHLAELAVAIELIDHGVRPADAAALLVKWRPTFRNWFEKAFEERYKAYPVNHPEFPVAYGLFIELTVTYSRDHPGIHIPKLLTPPEAAGLLFGTGRQICSRFLIQLSELLDRTVTRALEAPAMSRGRPRQ